MQAFNKHNTIFYKRCRPNTYVTGSEQFVHAELNVVTHRLQRKSVTLILHEIHPALNITKMTTHPITMTKSDYHPQSTINTNSRGVCTLSTRFLS